MLVLKRKEGQWIEITHAASGDKIRIRVYNVMGSADTQGRVDMAFDDESRLFLIERPERILRSEAKTGSAAGPAWGPTIAHYDAQ